MPFIRSLVSKRRVYTVAVIFLFSEIMPSCSCCKEKKLVYIIIIALFSHQPSLCVKCTKLNIYLSYNVKSVSNTKCISKFFYNIYSPSQLLGGNTRWYVVFLALRCTR